MIKQLNLDVNDMFNKIIDIVGTGIYWKDSNGKYVGCNDHFLQIHGFENHGQIIGNTDVALDLSETDCLLIAQNERIALEQGGFESFEYRTVFGKRKMFSVKRSKLVNKRGEVAGILGVCTLLAEPGIDLRYKDTLLQQVIDTVNASIYWKDTEGRYLGCNKYVVDMAGVSSREEIIGKSDAELVWANSYDELFAVDTNVIKNGRFVGEEKFPTAHESERVFLTVKDQLIGTDGEVYGLIGTSLEISAQKEAEKLRIETARQRVTIEETGKFKKEANQVAHDIRSPLSTILMTLKVCQGIPEPQRVTLRDAATRINDIANNLIGRFRKEDGNPSPSEEQRESILVSSALLEILTEKKYQYQDRALKLGHHFSSAGNFAWIHIKPTALKRMVSNLINNAVDAFDDKPGQVTVNLDTNGEQVRIIIKDNGKGMSPQLVQKIESKISISEGKSGGHGIGMTQIHDTLDENEGQMYIESVVGQGTQITLTFPRVAAQNWIADSIQLYDDDTVVVLDDDSSIHKAWDFRFEPLHKAHPDLTVIHYHKGQDTIDYFSQLSPEKKQKVFLLSDYELLQQGMNGLQVIAKVGASRSALVTSYYAHRAIQQEAGKIGTRILPKQLAAEVPLRIDKRTSIDATATAVGPKAIDAIFVDDDQNLLSSYEYFIGDKYVVDTYHDPKEFMEKVSCYPKHTKIFLDQNYSNYDKKGEHLAEQLRGMGYARLYLLTGDPSQMPNYLTVLMKSDLDALSAALDDRLM